MNKRSSDIKGDREIMQVDLDILTIMVSINNPLVRVWGMLMQVDRHKDRAREDRDNVALDQLELQLSEEQQAHPWRRGCRKYQTRMEVSSKGSICLPHCS